jgi:lysophospholipase L1-like esterase
MTLRKLLCIALLASMTELLCAQAPAPRPQPTPEQAEAFRKAADERLRKDWAQLKKYEAQNEKLLASSNKANGPVYMGDSITEFWWRYDSAFWKDNAYIDRGISGQTSSQMLVRFRQDVVNLHPSVVLINAGTNDIAENTGPISLELVFGNIVSMVEIAKANNIRVVLSSVLPAYDFSWKQGLAPAEKIIRLNSMIKEYAAKNKLEYVDYWTALKDDVNGLQAKYTFDGVHPNLDGYKVMEPLAKTAIDAALKRR